MATMRRVERSRIITLLAFTAFVLIYTLTSSIQHLASASSAVRSKIVFESREGNTWQIYLANDDGSGAMRLTKTAADNRAPSWSPDGTRIVFVSNRDGNSEIYVMDIPANLSAFSTLNSQLSTLNITHHAAQDGSPVWSSDGKRIAFVSDRDGNQEVYLMQADGSGQTRLTVHEARDYSPSWSPDGTQLAFVSRRDGNYEIYTMNSDGTNQVNLSRHQAEDGRGFHSWSPDGKQIAWVTDRDMKGDGNWEIYLMDADGSHVTNLTRNPANDDMGMLIWSPIISGGPCGSENRPPMPPGDPNVGPLRFAGANPHIPHTRRGQAEPDPRPAQPLAKPEGCLGQRIAFVSYRDGNSEVYVMDRDGSHPRNLSNHPAMDRDPVWSPEGNRIAFISNRSGQDEIYIVSSDGTDAKRITSGLSEKGHLRWQP